MIVFALFEQHKQDIKISEINDDTTIQLRLQSKEILSIKQSLGEYGAYLKHTAYSNPQVNSIISEILNEVLSRKSHSSPLVLLEKLYKTLFKASGSISDFITGNAKDEIPLLESLAKSSNQDLKSRALYRLSMIYKLGRSSNLEQDINIH